MILKKLPFLENPFQNGLIWMVSTHILIQSGLPIFFRWSSDDLRRLLYNNLLFFSWSSWFLFLDWSIAVRADLIPTFPPAVTRPEFILFFFIFGESTIHSKINDRQYTEWDKNSESNFCKNQELYSHKKIIKWSK